MFKNAALRSFFLLSALCLLLLHGLGCTSLQQVTNHNAQDKGHPWIKPGLLTSERIKEKFGSFGVQVLFQDEQSGFRLSNLFSELQGEKITRALALVKFEPLKNKELLEAHAEILDGKSIGSTLRDHGFLLKKTIMYRGQSSQMPVQLRRLMKIKSDMFATVVYRLEAIKDNESYFYCTITEVYSPDFLTVADINQLYKGKPQADSFGAVAEKLAISQSQKDVEDNLTLIRTMLSTL